MAHSVFIPNISRNSKKVGKKERERERDRKRMNEGREFIQKENQIGKNNIEYM